MESTQQIPLLQCRGGGFYHPGTPVGFSSGFDIFWDVLDFCIVGPRSGISVAPLAYKESEAVSGIPWGRLSEVEEIQVTNVIGRATG